MTLTALRKSVFKETNDRFGHRTGDEILVLLGRSIQRELRGSDVAARFGGDEFIVLLPHTSADDAAGLADRVVGTFDAELIEHFPELPATLSVGAASLQTTCAATAEALIHEADLALYAAKQGGRNRLAHAASPPPNA